MLDTYTFDEWQDCLKGATPMATESTDSSQSKGKALYTAKGDR